RQVPRSPSIRESQSAAEGYCGSDPGREPLPGMPQDRCGCSQRGSRHAALDMGCETCHLTHKNGDRGKIEFAAHLKKDVPALCIECHDVKDAALQKTHQDQPFGSANCLQCHNPHQSAKP